VLYDADDGRERAVGVLVGLQSDPLAHGAGRPYGDTVQIWGSWPPGAEPSELFRLIAQRPVGNRPGRSEPRVRKRRPKSFPWLKVPRAIARRQIRKRRHPLCA
jgi:hypothetical protein